MGLKTTIEGMLCRTAASCPNEVALMSPSGLITYGQLLILSSKCADAVKDFGVGRGDRVAIMLQNGIPFVCAHFGILLAGAISVPLDPNLKSDELSRIMESSQPLMVFTSESSYQPTLKAVASDLPELLVVSIECSSQEVRTRVLKAWKVNVRLARSEAPTHAECDVLMYTSGTSGISKGAMISDHNVLAVAKSVKDYVRYSSDYTEVIALPLAHSFGLGQLYVCIYTGACACIGSDLAFPVRLLHEVKASRATGFSCTPAMLGLLLKHCPQLFSKCSDHLRYCVVNSAAVPPQLVDKIHELNGKFRIFHYYGLTEASRTTFICFNDYPSKRLSVGRPMRHANVTIVGDDGAELSRGNVGQILISGGAVFGGYWRDSGSTDRVMDNGWFYSGDIAYVDTDGFLFLVGRMSDVINVDGMKFHPAEVEAILLGIPGVLDAGVVAVRSDKELVGLTVIATVVVQHGSVLNREVLRTECTRRLRSFKVPKVFVPIGEIPRFSSGKIDRKRLMALAEIANC